MKAIVDFLNCCANLPIGNDFVFFIENSISSLSKVDFEKNRADLIKYLKEKDENGAIGTIAIGIGKCQEYCDQKCDRVYSAKNDKDLGSFVQLLRSISLVIEEILKPPAEKDVATLQDISNINTILESYNKKIEELQAKLKDVSKGVHEQNNIFDSKVFQLLVNTISILGIFVAIAFAGFGGASIFTNVTIDLTENFLCSVFSLFLIALFLYNFLFLLMYFIFVILRTFYYSNKYIVRVVPKAWATFKSLYIIDIILTAITVILFFVVLSIN